MKRILSAFFLVAVATTVNAQGVGVGATVSIGAQMLCSTPEALNIFSEKLGLPIPKTATDKRYAGGCLMEAAAGRYQVLAIITLGEKRVAFLRTLPPAPLHTGWTFANELRAR